MMANKLQILPVGVKSSGISILIPSKIHNSGMESVTKAVSQQAAVRSRDLT